MYKHLYKQAWPPRWLWQPRWNLGFGQWWEMLTSRTSLKSSRRILRPCSHSMKHSIRQHPALTFSIQTWQTCPLICQPPSLWVEVQSMVLLNCGASIDLQKHLEEASLRKIKGQVQKGEHLGSIIACRGMQKWETCCSIIGITSGFVVEWADTLASQRIVKIRHQHECHRNKGSLLLTLSFLPLVVPHFDLFFGWAHQVGDHVKCFVIDAHRPVMFTGLQEICRDGQD